jgi:hypothetical protein
MLNATHREPVCTVVVVHVAIAVQVVGVGIVRNS